MPQWIVHYLYGWGATVHSLPLGCHNARWRPQRDIFMLWMSVHKHDTYRFYNIQHPCHRITIIGAKTVFKMGFEISFVETDTAC